jgi:hypothetical protein
MGWRVLNSGMEIKMGDFGQMRRFTLGINFINRAVFVSKKTT